MALLLATPPLAQGSSIGWYLTRDTAVTAYVALTLTVLLGILQPLARQMHMPLSWIVDEVHRMTAILTVLLTATHLVTVVTNGVVQFSWLDILVPGPKYGAHTLPANLGIFGLYALVAVIASSLAKRRLRHEYWRRLHLLSYFAFVLVTAHGWIAGSDTSTTFIQAMYVSAATAVAVLALLRFALFRFAPLRQESTRQSPPVTPLQETRHSR